MKYFMFKPNFVVRLFSVGLLVLVANGVCGQSYPVKPIRIVTAVAGGSNDFMARMVAQGISGPLGQQVIVDNRATSAIAAEAMLKAPPDGYTLHLAGSTVWMGSLLERRPFDALRDFTPVSLVGVSPLIVVVHPSLPVKSVKELMALAKARPGELNYASGGSGSSSHLGTELFKAMAGVNIVRIPYKGTAQALTDLMGGQVQVMFSTTPSVMPHMKSGRLKALAVTSAQPTVLAPGLPTVAAAGLPGYESAGPDAMVAPINTPGAIVNRLSQEIVRFLSTAEAKEKFMLSGVDAIGSSPEELGVIIKTETAKLAKVIKDAGIRAD